MKRILGLFVSVTRYDRPLCAGESKMDVVKMFELECQGCHGPNHEGGVGSSLEPKVIGKKNAYMLAETILNGKAGTAMPAYKGKMNKDDADKMVDYLLKYEGQQIKNLTLKDVEATHKILQNRDELYKKYPKPTNVKAFKDIVVFTERDASKVGFIDGTTNKVLSKHESGFATRYSGKQKNSKICLQHQPRWLGKLFDLNAPGQPIIAKIRVGSDSRGQLARQTVNM